MTSDFEVGYGKPPKHTRYQKGQSGNPKGRPKGSRNFSTDVKAALQTPVQINSGGRPRKVSTQEAAILRLREMALKGNPRALDRFLSLARDHNNEELEAAVAKSLGTEDQQLMQHHEARIRRQTKPSSPRRRTSAKEKKQ